MNKTYMSSEEALEVTAEDSISDSMFWISITVGVLLVMFAVIWLWKQKRQMQRGKASQAASGEFQGVRYRSI